MKEAQLWSNLLIALLALNTLTKGWLDRRNIRYIKQHADQVPPRFAEKISLEDHQKAASYSEAKLQMGQIFRLYGLLIFAWWIFMGGLNQLDLWVRAFELSPILQGVVFFLAFSGVNLVLELPESLYSTFVLEARFGFNRTTPKVFAIDLVKSIILSVLIGAPIFAAILAIMQFLGASWWVWAWAFMTAFQLIMVWAYPRIIAPLFNKFTELPEGEIKTRVLALLERCHFVSKGLFVMDASKRSTHGNAYFTGLGNNKRIVFFDTLLEKLEAKEVEAVLAHELGHFRHNHILKKMVTIFGLSLFGFAILGMAYSSEIFYFAHGVATPSSYIALILFSLLAPVYTFFLTPLSAWFSRKHEFEADLFAHKNSDAEALISALLKLHKENAGTLTPDPVYANFYYSHPPAPIRIAHLDGLILEGKE